MAANPWPSSDWVAAVSERGIVAALALISFMLLLLRNAWRGWGDSVYSSRERVGALAGGSVILVGAIEGSFDAVALLAFPALVMWAAAGALIPSGKPAFTRPARDRDRPFAVLAAVLLWGSFTAFSAAKIHAMRLYTKGGYEDVRSAAVYDPESYRIQLRAAEVQAARGYCKTGFHNAMNAVALFPHAQAAQQVLARCGGPERQ
jgi:hypothetical protein